MVSENDPDISVAWFDDPNWVDIRDYCKEFRARDTGVLKVSQAEIRLDNRGGRFTQGANKIDPYSHIRIKGNVRGVWDSIFAGRFFNYKGDYTLKDHSVELVCRGYSQRLLRDTETRAYGEEDEGGINSWTLKQVIEQFLAYPDSGYSTDITLETDTGTITTTHAGEECNFEREQLLDALKKIAEKINYDGYLKLYDSSLILVFKASGTVYANPSVTLTHPFTFVRPELGIDDVENYGLIWGGIEVGRPVFMDEWTEDLARYSPPHWIANNAATTVIADSVWKKVNQKSIKVSATAADIASAQMDISRTEEGLINATERFVALDFWIRADPLRGIDIELEDDVTPTPNKILWQNLKGAIPIRKFIIDTDWTSCSLPMGPTVPIYDSSWEGFIRGGWWYSHKETTFSWKIKKVHVSNDVGDEPTAIWVDGLYFKGGRTIHPLVYPTWNPPVKDDTSIELYGRSLFHYVNQSIYSVEKAQDIGKIILDIRKDPHRKVVCKKGAKIWVNPSEVLTLNVPQYEINNEEWRVLEKDTEWKTPKLLRTTFTLVPKTFKVSSEAYLEDTISGLIKGE